MLVSPCPSPIATPNCLPASPSGADKDCWAVSDWSQHSTGSQDPRAGGGVRKGGMRWGDRGAQLPTSTAPLLLAFVSNRCDSWVPWCAPASRNLLHTSGDEGPMGLLHLPNPESQTQPWPGVCLCPQGVQGCSPHRPGHQRGVSGTGMVSPSGHLESPQCSTKHFRGAQSL